MGEVAPGSRLDRRAAARATVRQLREHGMTQGQICRQLGVSPALVSGWAKGKRAPSAEQLAALRELGSGKTSEVRVKRTQGGQDHSRVCVTHRLWQALGFR